MWAPDDGLQTNSSPNILLYVDPEEHSSELSFIDFFHRLADVLRKITCNFLLFNVLRLDGLTEGDDAVEAAYPRRIVDVAVGVGHIGKLLALSAVLDGLGAHIGAATQKHFLKRRALVIVVSVGNSDDDDDILRQPACLFC